MQMRGENLYVDEGCSCFQAHETWGIFVRVENHVHVLYKANHICGDIV